MTHQNTQLKFVRAADLVHASNIRQTASAKEDAEMKASILAQGGVQQNLIAAPRKTDGMLAVFAGGRRLTNTMALIEDGKLEADFELPVMIRDDIDPDSPEAIELALTENVIRASMDYIDECNAMMMLAASGRSDEDIAASFDYRPRTIRERLLIATIAPEAQDLVRSQERNLEWARALTIADKAMQKKICDDVAANANAWKTGDDIRNYLTKSTIAAEHALFDVDEYDGVIVKDFFEGDKFADTDKFWALQNDAITTKVVDLEAKGFGRGVRVIYEPFPEWAYEETQDLSEAMAFIEVMPNGAVREITNVTPIVVEGRDDDATLDANDKIQAESLYSSDIASFEVRATPRICEYAAGQRTAMLQARLAGDFRASLEYTTLAFLGHRSASFAANAFQIPGEEETRSGPAFAVMNDAVGSIAELTEFTAEERDIETREAMQVAIIRSMDDADLQQLFSLLVAQRAGQNNSRNLDQNKGSLSNVFGADVNIRDFWAPDEFFFDMMGSEDLRRLATEFLPAKNALAFAKSKRKHLVQALAKGFAEASEGILPASQAEPFNRWVPGVMSFPAHVVTAEELEETVFDDTDDLEASIFSDDEIAA